MLDEVALLPDIWKEEGQFPFFFISYSSHARVKTSIYYCEAVNESPA